MSVSHIIINSHFLKVTKWHDPSMRDNSRRLRNMTVEEDDMTISVMKACNLLYVPGFWNGLLGRDLLLKHDVHL